MKRVIMAVSLLAVFVASCCNFSCGTAKDESVLQNKQEPPEPTGTVIELKTVDQYTGSLGGFGSAYMLILPGLIDSSQAGQHGRSTGFMTFGLAGLVQGDTVEKAQLDFYTIDVSQCEKPTIVISYLTPDDSQYATWQGFSCWAPNPCNIHGFWTSEVASTKFKAIPMGNGWWQVKDSAEFRNVFQQDINNGIKYITFIPGTILCDGQEDVGLNMDRELIIEDGGNHGQTGNLPTLTITYEE